jgi:glycosyltransferase involved in cell wall biosynthesis
MVNNKKNKNKIFIKYKKIIFFIIFFFNNSSTKKYINFNSEFNNIEKYFKVCNNSNLKIKKKFKKYKYPKVSIISPVYNREKFILRFLRSIQNQKFKDVEIIFVDDCSKDKSAKLIEEYKKKDERIILIKNKKNKGTFICRNEGVLNSRGKYIMLSDPDDILSRNIIYYCYYFLEINNYEMVRFNLYKGNGKIFFFERIKGLESRPIYQPELSTYLFYGKGKLLQIDFNVSNKFIKRDAYIKALNTLNNYYLNLYMTVLEDGLMNYFLYRTVKSLYFIQKVGYYYLTNNESITNTKFRNKKLKLKFIFLYLKFIFEFSKNTKYEKDMANALFYTIFKKKYISKYKKYLQNEYYFYYNIIRLYLNCQYIDKKIKIILRNFKH